MNLKIIQAHLEGDVERGQARSMAQLKSLGERYIKIENACYDQDPPLDKIIGGNSHWWGEHFMELTSRSYGCWLSHKQSIMLGFCDEGHSLICEGDCKIFDEEKFKDRLKEGVDLLNRTDHPILRFEPFYQCHMCPCWVYGPDGRERVLHPSTKYYDQITDNIFECDKIAGTHCYLINEKSKSLFEHLFATVGWIQWDVWLNVVFAKDPLYVHDEAFAKKHGCSLEKKDGGTYVGESGRVMLSFPEYGGSDAVFGEGEHSIGRLTGQFDGFSEIDMEYKDGTNGGHLFRDWRNPHN